MRTALGSVLAIHERIVFLAVLIAMCKRNFDVLAFKVNNRIQWFSREILLEQVE
jgi:hypothetical protein